jgi:hypothetical protein
MRGSNSGPGEVEAAEHGVYAVDPGEPTSVPDDVDHPGVAAAGEDDEPFADHVDDHGLVVEDQRVALPPGPPAVPGGTGSRSRNRWCGPPRR